MYIVFFSLISLLGVWAISAFIVGMILPSVFALVALLIPQYVTFRCIEMTDRRWPQYAAMLLVNFLLMMGLLLLIRNYSYFSQFSIAFMFGLLLAILIKGVNWYRTHL